MKNNNLDLIVEDGVVNATSLKYHMERILDLQIKKNHDYGNSIERGVNKRGWQYIAIQLENKLNRFDQLIENNSALVNESLTDTLDDIIGYALHATTIAHGPNFIPQSKTPQTPTAGTVLEYVDKEVRKRFEGILVHVNQIPNIITEILDDLYINHNISHMQLIDDGYIVSDSLILIADKVIENNPNIPQTKEMVNRDGHQYKVAVNEEEEFTPLAPSLKPIPESIKHYVERKMLKRISKLIDLDTIDMTDIKELIEAVYNRLRENFDIRKGDYIISVYDESETIEQYFADDNKILSPQHMMRRTFKEVADHVMDVIISNSQWNDPEVAYTKRKKQAQIYNKSFSQFAGFMIKEFGEGNVSEQDMNGLVSLFATIKENAGKNIKVYIEDPLEGPETAETTNEVDEVKYVEMIKERTGVDVSKTKNMAITKDIRFLCDKYIIADGVIIDYAGEKYITAFNTLYLLEEKVNPIFPSFVPSEWEVEAPIDNTLTAKAILDKYFDLKEENQA